MKKLINEKRDFHSKNLSYGNRCRSSKSIISAIEEPVTSDGTILDSQKNDIRVECESSSSSSEESAFSEDDPRVVFQRSNHIRTRNHLGSFADSVSHSNPCSEGSFPSLGIVPNPSSPDKPRPNKMNISNCENDSSLKRKNRISGLRQRALKLMFPESSIKTKLSDESKPPLTSNLSINLPKCPRRSNRTSCIDGIRDHSNTNRSTRQKGKETTNQKMTPMSEKQSKHKVSSNFHSRKNCDEEVPSPPIQDEISSDRTSPKWGILSKLPVVLEEDEDGDSNHNAFFSRHTSDFDEDDEYENPNGSMDDQSSSDDGQSTVSFNNDLLSHSTSGSVKTLLKKVSSPGNGSTETTSTYQTQSTSSFDDSNSLSSISSSSGSTKYLRKATERKQFASTRDNSPNGFKKGIKTKPGKDLEVELAERLNVILVLKDIILQQRKIMKLTVQENQRLKLELKTCKKTVGALNKRHIKDKTEIMRLQQEVVVLKKKLQSAVTELERSKLNKSHNTFTSRTDSSLNEQKPSRVVLSELASINRSSNSHESNQNSVIELIEEINELSKGQAEPISHQLTSDNKGNKQHSVLDFIEEINELRKIEDVLTSVGSGDLVTTSSFVPCDMSQECSNAKFYVDESCLSQIRVKMIKRIESFSSEKRLKKNQGLSDVSHLQEI